jgi:hypothetical protein
VTAAPRRDDPCVARLAVRWMRPPPRRATVSRRRPTERRTDRGRHLTVARWSGAAGILGSLLLIGVFILVAVFVGTEPAEPEGLLTGFPEVRTAHILENTVYLASIALWVVHALALYQALRRRQGPQLPSSVPVSRSSGWPCSPLEPSPISGRPRSPTSTTLPGRRSTSRPCWCPLAGDARGLQRAARHGAPARPLRLHRLRASDARRPHLGAAFAGVGMAIHGYDSRGVRRPDVVTIRLPGAARLQPPGVRCAVVWAPAVVGRLRVRPRGCVVPVGVHHRPHRGGTAGTDRS